MTEITSILSNPNIIAVLIVSLLGNCYFFGIIYKVRSILKTYAKMTVARSRITADNKITIDDPDIIPFVEDTFTLMGDIENVLHWITGYILNHPSTGWIKGYAPQLIAVEGAVFQELIKDDDLNIPKSDQVQPPTATTSEQPISQ
jgi:hypothetical protein